MGSEDAARSNVKDRIIVEGLAAYVAAKRHAWEATQLIEERSRLPGRSVHPRAR